MTEASHPELPREDGSPGRFSLRPCFQFRPDLLDPTYGVRAAVFVVVPLFLGLATGQVVLGVLVTLGALNLFLVQAPRPTRTPVRLVAGAVVTNSVAWVAGTLVGVSSGPLEWLLVGMGVFTIMMAKRYTAFNQLALIAAVMFVVAAGLPGGLENAVPHGALIALGGLWALVGVALPASFRWIERPLPPLTHHPATDPMPVDVTVRFSLAVAATVVAGLAIGTALGLPRDYWVMLTALVALRPELADTFQYASMRVLGTIAGAAIAFGVAFSISDAWVLGALVVLAATVTFMVRAVNYTVYALAVTVFLILLLNLAYHGGPSLAVDRVFDTILGGGLALVTGLGLVLWKDRHRFVWTTALAAPPRHPV